MAALGADAATRAAWAERAAAQRIEIEPENVSAVRLFLGLSTQWRTMAITGGSTVMIVRTSLDYASLGVVAGALGITLDDEVLAGVRLMEAEALEAMTEQLRVSA